MERMLHMGCDLFIELGPGGVLAGLLQRTRKGTEVLSVSDLPSLQKAAERLQSLCASALTNRRQGLAKTDCQRTDTAIVACVRVNFCYDPDSFNEPAASHAAFAGHAFCPASG